jgi:nicotinamidase-related amidase
MRRLQKDSAILVVIDVQERLAKVIDDIDGVEANIERLVRGAALLGVPSVVTEQYPKGIGPTTSGIRSAFEEAGSFEPIQKMCFSSWGCSEFAEKIRASGRTQIIVTGIEAHVCVHQTTLDLLDQGFSVWIVADAVSSRTARNREIAVQRMAGEGARLTSTEMALFEMTVEAGTDTFKAISRLVK